MATYTEEAREAYAPYDFAALYAGSNRAVGPTVMIPEHPPVVQMMPSITQQSMPAPTTLVMPSITTVLPPPAPALAPADLMHNLPSIVNTAPLQMPAPCSGFTSWVSDNPAMALLGLGALAYFLLHRKQ